MLIKDLFTAIRLCNEQRKLANIQKKRIPQVRIWREIRYFADYDGVTYPLEYDWYNEVLSEKLDRLGITKGEGDDR